MKAEEFLEAVREMSPAERRQLAKNIMADSDGLATFSAELDRLVNRAVISHDENLKASGKIANRSELEKRMDNIEQGYQRKAAALELEYYAKMKAYQGGFDYALIEGTWGDKSAIDARADLISSTIRDQRRDSINAEMVTRSHKPKMGNGPAPADSLATLTTERAIQLEKAGKLNDLIPRKAGSGGGPL